MKVSAILKGKKDQYGRQPVQIRINIGDKRKFKPTGIKVEPHQLEKGIIVKHPDAKKLNEILKRKIIETESSLLHKTHEVFSSDKDLYVYIQDSIREWSHSKKETTLNKHLSEVKKLQKFAASVQLNQITTVWLNRYRSHLLQIGNQENTVWGSLKFLRTIIRKAHREKLITSNPFELFQMPKYKDPPKVFLSKTQIEKIDGYMKKATAEEIHAGTWFLISCYTGLRFGDLITFSKDRHIKNGRIILYTGKTNELISMPLSDKLRAWFERINYKPLCYVNIHYNRLLKQIAGKVGIKENISSHTARHTFATMAATAGISQEVTSKLLGHRSLKTTSIYYKIINTRIDEELGKME